MLSGRSWREEETASRKKRQEVSGWIWKELPRRDLDQVELFLRVWQRSEASYWLPPVAYRCSHSSSPPAQREAQHSLQRPGPFCLQPRCYRLGSPSTNGGAPNSVSANQVC